MGVSRKGTRIKPGVPAAYHVPSGKNPARCGACGRPWPCGSVGSTDHDCGHVCCDERDDALHDHFLTPDRCPTCQLAEALADSLPESPPLERDPVAVRLGIVPTPGDIIDRAIGNRVERDQILAERANGTRPWQP